MDDSNLKSPWTRVRLTLFIFSPSGFFPASFRLGSFHFQFFGVGRKVNQKFKLFSPKIRHSSCSLLLRSKDCFNDGNELFYIFFSLSGGVEIDLRLAKKSLGNFLEADILVSAVLYLLYFSKSWKAINLLFISILCLLYVKLDVKLDQ